MVSLNVRGLGDADKRHRILTWLAEHADVACLQETFCPPEEQRLAWLAEWRAMVGIGGQWVWAFGTQHCAGVAILHKGGIPTGQIRAHAQGRYLLLSLEWEQQEWTLGSVYAPADPR